MVDDSFRARFRNIPLAIYDLDARPLDNPGPRTADAHNHQEFEIILILEGELNIKIHNEVLNAKSGDIVFIAPYAVHSLSLCECPAILHHCICFNLSILDNPELAKKIEENILFVTPFVPSRHPLSNFLASSIKLIRQSYIEGKEGWEMIAKGQMMTLFGILSSYNLIQPTAKPSRDNLFCREVTWYIEKHYATNITSNTVAKSLSYDHSYFCRLFKKNFGRSFSEYLCMYRVFMARELFDKGYKSVAFIANSVGFNNISYFTKMFKKYIGCLPSRYLKEYMKVHI